VKCRKEEVKMKSKIVILSILGIVVVGGIVFAVTKALQGLDVVGKESLNSFKVVTKELKDNITPDTQNGGWSLVAPDTSVRFIWSKDFSKSSFHDVMLEFEAEPFIAAGLDVDKLPDGIAFDDMIMVGTKLGNEKITYKGEATPYKSYEKIVDLKRTSIKYHSALDHYGIDLGDGNVFEWAKDMDTNDKDIVFALNPEPFITAGVNPDKVEGWIFAKVPTMQNGKKVEVYKLLKPFNLK
jgi:hypothetical protein